MAGAILGKFSGKACDSNVFNNNDMLLNRELFENVLASDEYKDGIERGHYIGYLGHPEDPGCQEFQNACIVMTSMSLENNGDVHADFNLVDTPVGRIVKAFIDAGVKFGISIRGAGDIAGDGKVDPDTFIFRGYDLVAFPAYNDCVPEFQAIAASKDLDKQKKYKKVCAAVETNLKNITSCAALELIKDQLVEGSAPYVQVTERLEELSTPEAVTEECQDNMGCSIASEQVNALVSMYAESLQQIEALQNENDRLQNALQEVNTSFVNASNKLKRIQRIHQCQIDTLDDAVTAAEKEVELQKDKFIKANKRIDQLNSALNAAKKLNLNYSQKIQSSKSLLEQKDSELKRLSSKLSETVTASKELVTNASNCDARVNELEGRIAAAEEMIFAYQQAYANLFANALGKKVSNLSVTASTTPEALKQSIIGGTSTANIPAKPEYSQVEYFESDVDDEYGIVSV